MNLFTGCFVFICLFFHTLCCERFFVNFGPVGTIKLALFMLTTSLAPPGVCSLRIHHQASLNLHDGLKEMRGSSGNHPRLLCVWIILDFDTNKRFLSCFSLNICFINDFLK